MKLLEMDTFISCILAHLICCQYPYVQYKISSPRQFTDHNRIPDKQNDHFHPFRIIFFWHFSVSRFHRCFFHCLWPRTCDCWSSLFHLFYVTNFRWGELVRFWDELLADLFRLDFVRGFSTFLMNYWENVTCTRLVGLVAALVCSKAKKCWGPVECSEEVEGSGDHTRKAVSNVSTQIFDPYYERYNRICKLSCSFNDRNVMVFRERTDLANVGH